MSVPLPKDGDGRTARKCENETCSPGYFKVKTGTGITSNQESAFCPYCGHEAGPDAFFTEEQRRYAEDIALGEVQQGVEEMMLDALGLGFSGQLGSKPIIRRRPFEEEVRRDVVCPYCGLDHSVYGLAIWCADCGKDIFLTHVEAELSIVRAMLDDVKRRRQQLGPRVAAKDLENCLEDTVSIFEAVLRALVKRYKYQSGDSEETVNKFFNKEIRNAFQNIRRSEKIFASNIGLPLFDDMADEDIEKLSQTFEKRHPITHNLGVIDKKYIENARSAEREGKEILITAQEINQSLDFSIRIFSSLHKRMFVADPTVKSA